MVVLLGVASLAGWLPTAAPAQEVAPARERLPRERFRSGEAVLRAFEPVSRATHGSVVKLDLNGASVALAAVIDKRGLAVTKASEIKAGKLTCWLPAGNEVEAELIGVDDPTDVALVRIKAAGLKPVRWSSAEVAVGGWLITPGTAETPQAVGIVSAAPRKIMHKRALIGIQLDMRSGLPRVRELMDGLGAAQAGLKPGDRILSVNNLAVNEREQLMETLRAFREGDVVQLRIKRDAEEFDVRVHMMVPKQETDSGGMDRSERLDRMGTRTSERAEGFDLAIQHDTVLQDWQCGGPVVNLNGEAIGINIARAGRVASYALPAGLVRQAIDNIQARTRLSRDAKPSGR
jgi:serine protease Do